MDGVTGSCGGGASTTGLNGLFKWRLWRERGSGGCLDDPVKPGDLSGAC